MKRKISFLILIVSCMCISSCFDNEGDSKKTYKYGDSDVYQGSSKQAEDLKAIDAYGANNPDFW